MNRTKSNRPSSYPQNIRVLVDEADTQRRLATSSDSTEEQRINAFGQYTVLALRITRKISADLHLERYKENIASTTKAQDVSRLADNM